jgi:UTP--glucose-1-phosphate uridylyltransferase
LIFITGRNKRAIEDHFDRSPELESELFSKGNTEQVNMVRNILPEGVECIFVRQPKQLGLGHAILCSERAVGNEPFAILLADDFIISNGKGVTNDLIGEHKKTGKAQLSVMQVDGPGISKYGVLKHDDLTGAVAGLIEKPEFKNAPSKLASIGRYVLNPDIFDILRNQSFGSGGEIQLADAINSQAKVGKVEASLLNGLRFDCGSVQGYLDAIMHSSELYYEGKINL